MRGITLRTGFTLDGVQYDFNPYLGWSGPAPGLDDFDLLGQAIRPTGVGQPVFRQSPPPVLPQPSILGAL